MKLYMQKDGFRWGGSQPLTDRSGRTRYTVSGEAYSHGRRIHVTDLAGREAIYIRQVIPSLFPRYEIEVYGKPVAELKKDLTFAHPRCTIESLGWEVMGSLGRRKYEILLEGRTLCASGPDPENPDRLLLSLSADKQELLTALGVMLTINCIFATQESGA